MTKYIITKDNWPVIFSPCFTHAEMAIGEGEILGAGFVKIAMTPRGEARFKCFGESIFLKIKRAKE